MSGDILRRTSLCMLGIALLLPTASAFAAPTGGSPAIVSRARDWSRMVFRSVDDVLRSFERAAEAITEIEYDPRNDPKNGEGNGIDPHGKPKP